MCFFPLEILKLNFSSTALNFCSVSRHKYSKIYFSKKYSWQFIHKQHKKLVHQLRNLCESRHHFSLLKFKSRPIYFLRISFPSSAADKTLCLENHYCNWPDVEGTRWTRHVKSCWKDAVACRPPIGPPKDCSSLIHFQA